MSPADVEHVMEIEVGSYPTAWTSDDFHRQLASPRHLYWAAESGDRIVGYTGIEFNGARGHVTTVTVDPHYRKQGIGTQLMAALTAEAARRGVTEVRLEVGIRNQDARALYRRFGFAIIGVRRGYYPGEDALIMSARVR